MGVLLLRFCAVKKENKMRWIVRQPIERTKKTLVMCIRRAPWKLNELQMNGKNNVSDRFVARYCFARAHWIATAHIITWVLNRIVVIELYNATDCWCTVIFNNGLCHCNSFYRIAIESVFFATFIGFVSFWLCDCNTQNTHNYHQTVGLTQHLITYLLWNTLVWFATSEIHISLHRMALIKWELRTGFIEQNWVAIYRMSKGDSGIYGNHHLSI